jgi:hypothetical protein
MEVKNFRMSTDQLYYFLMENTFQKLFLLFIEGLLSNNIIFIIFKEKKYGSAKFFKF